MGVLLILAGETGKQNHYERVKKMTNTRELKSLIRKAENNGAIVFIDYNEQARNEEGREIIEAVTVLGLEGVGENKMSAIEAAETLRPVLMPVETMVDAIRNNRAKEIFLMREVAQAEITKHFSLDEILAAHKGFTLEAMQPIIDVFKAAGYGNIGLYVTIRDAVQNIVLYNFEANEQGELVKKGAQAPAPAVEPEVYKFLMPVSVNLTPAQCEQFNTKENELRASGFDAYFVTPTILIVKQSPADVKITCGNDFLRFLN